MKTISRYLAAAAVLITLTASAFAQDYIILDRRADEFDSWQDRVDWTYGNPVVSREFDVPVTVLEEQRTRTGLGYGGLMIANALARDTGRSFDDIVAMKQSGMGWGRIAQENGVKLGPIVSRFDRADNAFRSFGNPKRDAMKAQKFVNGHDARNGRLDRSARTRGGNAAAASRGKGNAGGGKGRGQGRGGGKGKAGGGGKGKK
ncbi:MAG TPA: hypothetical protein VK993_09950 [Chthoniobacterales bacterium]|nr:hypothetical protein [Chthoniobacterales bacterium]